MAKHKPLKHLLSCKGNNREKRCWYTRGGQQM